MEPGYSIDNPIHLDKVAVAGNLQEHVQQLAAHIGERNMGRYLALMQASHYIQHVLRKPCVNLYLHSYECHGLTVNNVIAEHRGVSHPEQVIIVGANYDTAIGSAGFNDNATGIAALLELNRLLLEYKTAKTIRLVAFVNSEPPFKLSDEMGSYQYIQQLQNQGLEGVLILKAIACCFKPSSSQRSVFAASKQLHIGNRNKPMLLSNLNSRPLLTQVAKPLQHYSQLAIKGLAVPSWLPGINYSDNWSFWQEGIASLMLSCLPFTFSRCCTKPNEIDYVQLAQLVLGFAKALLSIANGKTPL